MPLTSVLVALVAAGASPGADDGLRERLDRLEARLARLESGGDGWLASRRAAEIRALVLDVLDDADGRTSLQGQAPTAGYEKGAVISSEDGSWSVTANVLLQTRFEASAMSGDGSFDSTAWGFEVTRARIDLSGHVVRDDWFYRLQIETSTNAAGLVAPVTTTPDARTGLLDAYVGYDFDDGLRIVAGRFKPPLLFEELTDSSRQQAVERSLINYLFTASRTQGIMLERTRDFLRFRLAYTNGINDGLYGGMVTTTPPGTPALAPDTKWAVTGRIDFLAFGNWAQFADYTSPPGSELGLLIGGALHAQQSETNALPDVELVVLTLDASAELGGSNLYASMTWAHADRPVPLPDAQPWGVVVGGGFYLNDTWEVFGRYEWGDTSTLSSADINILTAGVNAYLSGQNLKWTTDAGVAFDPVLPLGSGSGAGTLISPATGWRHDLTGRNGQVLVRMQLQMLF